METLKKTVCIPADHHLQLDLTLPEHFPTGEAEVLLIFAGKTPSPITKNKPELLELAGKLKASPHFKGDPLMIQKELRDEWQR